MLKWIIVFVVLGYAVNMQLKKEEELESNLSRIKYVSLHSLVPLLTFGLLAITIPGFDWFIGEKQDIITVLVKAPFYYLLYFSVIWLLGSPQRSNRFKLLSIICKWLLLLLSLFLLLLMYVFIGFMDKTVIIKHPTAIEKNIIENQFSIELTENTEILWLYCVGFQDYNYTVMLRLNEEDWMSVKDDWIDKANSNFSYKVDPKDENYIIVHLSVSDYLNNNVNPEFKELTQEGATIGNTIIRYIRMS